MFRDNSGSLCQFVLKETIMKGQITITFLKLGKNAYNSKQELMWSYGIWTYGLVFERETSIKY